MQPQPDSMYQPSQEDEMLDLQARLLLIEREDAQKEEGIRLLFSRYKKPLMGYLVHKFSDLTEDEQATVVNICFQEIYEMACDGTLNTNEALSGILFQTAHWRGIDARRRNSRRIPKGEKLLEKVGDYLDGTDVGADWSFARVLDKATIVMEEFKEFIRTLRSVQQKRVASIMADFLPDVLNDKTIADEYYERYETVIPVISVKGTKQVLIEKFREFLKRRTK